MTPAAVARTLLALRAQRANTPDRAWAGILDRTIAAYRLRLAVLLAEELTR